MLTQALLYKDVVMQLTSFLSSRDLDDYLFILLNANEPSCTAPPCVKSQDWTLSILFEPMWAARLNGEDV